MFASARLAAAIAASASVLFAAVPASAADLYDQPGADGAYYDDPYDADWSGYDTRRAPRAVPDRYAEPAPAYDPPYRPGVAVRDPKSFDESVIYSKSFQEPIYEREARYDGCVPRRVARMRLRRDGWRGFHDPQVRRNVVLVQAFSPSGRPFDLTIDRCSGDILDARPLGPRFDDEYAYRRYPDRRWRY